MHWYDGGNVPPSELFNGVTLKTKNDKGKAIQPPCASGVLLIGDKAKMYAAGDYAEKGVQIVGDVKEMDVDYPRSPGHEKEWFIAMRDPKKPAMSNFPNYAGPLTETILLGNLAVYKRGSVEWDPVQSEAAQRCVAGRIVHPTFRDGYEV